MQDHPQEKEMQKGKMLSEEALQIAEKRREVNGKGEKERYAHLNAELQRIARRDKKAFLSDWCKKNKGKQEWERLEISSRKDRETWHAAVHGVAKSWTQLNY